MIRYRKSRRIQDGIEIHDTRLTNEIALMEAMVLKYEKNLGQGITINKMLTKLRRLEGRHICERLVAVESSLNALMRAAAPVAALLHTLDSSSSRTVTHIVQIGVMIRAELAVLDGPLQVEYVGQPC